MMIYKCRSNKKDTWVSIQGIDCKHAVRAYAKIYQLEDGTIVKVINYGEFKVFIIKDYVVAAV